MKLVIGGAYQGKRAYVEAHYPNEAVVENFHLLLWEWLQAGIEPQSYLEEKLPDFLDKVVICEDIFCGVVPVDPLERRWREELGRGVTRVAREAEEVVRVFCGLGTRLK